jgi:uncharacterized protein YeaO (DUF488 family)
MLATGCSDAEAFAQKDVWEPDNADGFCVLVDRLWPRGKKQADLRLDM